ncbi:hypothetical protein PUP75_11420 [Pseudomonas chlororaphis]|uniref:hypothetical protein n=1 Tax=Pseudomonas chlororaphis TaxID=587753 RepID=UPI0023689FF0|nr:hypothetical protein [Pseudomonas chlororaphis]WDH55365.1 hypothetical protein PUP75_11420 [Pseudomonas chlororaphis]
MEFFKAFSIFSFGLYSVLGAVAVIALYLLFFGARCADMWMKRQPMPTDRVWAFVIVAALLGLFAGSFVQGIVEVQAECAAYGQKLGPCLIQTLTKPA